METIQLVLGVLAGWSHAVAFTLYLNQVYTGDSKPKLATWAVSAALMGFNALTFSKMGNGGVATFQFLVGFVGSFAVFLYCLSNRKFSRPNSAEIWAGSIGLVAAVVWAVFRQASWANMVILAALLISGWPTFDMVRQNPFTDRPRSWSLWALAYAITACNVALSAYRSDWHVVSLVNPIVGAVFHGLIAYMASDYRRDRWRTQNHRQLDALKREGDRA